MELDILCRLILQKIEEERKEFCENGVYTGVYLEGICDGFSIAKDIVNEVMPKTECKIK